MTENEISKRIIGVAIDLHKSVGAGLLESAYENALAYGPSGSGFGSFAAGCVAFCLQRSSFRGWLQD